MVAAGVRCHVLTASHQPYIEQVLQEHDLIKYFTHVFGIDNIHARGKTERAVELAATITKSTPLENIMLIGDTNHDYEVAKAIGVDALIIADGHQSYARLSSLGCAVLATRYNPT